MVELTFEHELVVVQKNGEYGAEDGREGEEEPGGAGPRHSFRSHLPRPCVELAHFGDLAHDLGVHSVLPLDFTNRFLGGKNREL